MNNDEIEFHLNLTELWKGNDIQKKIEKVGKGKKERSWWRRVREEDESRKHEKGERRKKCGGENEIKKMTEREEETETENEKGRDRKNRETETEKGNRTREGAHPCA